MAFGDHYQTLNVSSSASPEEIKRAYRKLALQYHPDTSQNPGVDSTKFQQVQQAYKVLSNPKTRQEFHYKHFNKKWQQQVITPVLIVQQASELAALIAVLSPYSINYDKLDYQLGQLLGGNIITTFLQQNNPKLITALVENILHCTNALPYHYAKPIHIKLVALAGEDNMLVNKINNHTSRQHLHFYWEKYKLLLALIITVVLCVCFYMLI